MIDEESIAWDADVNKRWHEWKEDEVSTRGDYESDQEVVGSDELIGARRLPRVLVVDRHGKLSSDLATVASQLNPSPELQRLDHPTRLVDVVAEDRPDVLVMAPAELTGAGLRRLAQAHRADPRLVIMLSTNGKPVSFQDAAACGASDILAYPSTPARMRAKMRRALETANELHTERVVIQQAPAPLPGLVESSMQVPRTKLGRVFTVASASGGCGKTFFATNLSAYLSRATGGKVILVDLDLQFGEVATTLHIRPERTIADLVNEEIVSSAISEYVVAQNSGYDVLCAPKDPMAAERVGPREAIAILQAAREAYDFVVVDTPPSLNEVVLAALDQSQSLVVMATMDVPSLKNLRVFLQTLDKLNLPTEEVQIVINKAEEGAGIDLKEVEPLYPQGFMAVLPYAKEVSLSLNVGVPVVEGNPGSQIAQKLIEGATKLVPPAPEVAHLWATAVPVRRGWRKWFGLGGKK